MQRKSPRTPACLAGLNRQGKIAADISNFIEIALARGPSRWHLISMKLEIAARQLESLGSPVRLKIYRALVRAGDEGLSCGVLQDKVGLAASTLSHHIRHMKEAGLVSQERQGTTLICRTNYPAMNRLVAYLVDECCVDAGCQSADKAA
jgi:ArsR family transcriptional regulator, arsenate/arsenite/antimonite-responsive transcriptional repressor